MSISARLPENMRYAIGPVGRGPWRLPRLFFGVLMVLSYLDSFIILLFTSINYYYLVVSS